MTASTSAVKATAKTALKNNRLSACVSSITVIFAFFVCYLTSGFVSFIATDAAGTAFFAALTFFLLAPLALGLLRFIWRMIFGVCDNPVSVFYYFSSKKLYTKAMRLMLSLTLRLLFFGALVFLPAIIVDLFTGVRIYEIIGIPIPLWTSNLYYLSVFLKTVAGVILVFIMARYYFAPFLVIADENIDTSEAVHMSGVLSGKTMLDLIYLFFSMLGWIILSVLVIPLIFTMPYLLTALSVHVRFAIAEYNKLTNGFGTTPPEFTAEV